MSIVNVTRKSFLGSRELNFYITIRAHELVLCSHIIPHKLLIRFVLFLRRHIIHFCVLYFRFISRVVFGQILRKPKPKQVLDVI
jgi:hypothetical protein